ncbi:hypothetical protein RND81_13G184400 [Saponaria officinalis]|uniref:Uncharacterized protein n=1 Tax=Saponaria officinalis TaxID=3572 RepID=A0AAW1H2X1_SAPOF
MGLLRALSTTKGRRGGYDRLLDETSDHNKSDAPILKRVVSVPARVLFGSSSRKIRTTSSSSSPSSSSSVWSQPSSVTNNRCNRPSNKEQEEKKKGGKVHPVFGLFDGRSWSKRKFTSNPEFSRYVEYLKEGGAVNGGGHGR